jgi:hypothetical protein
VNELAVVFGTEVVRRIRSRAFILSTVLGAAAIALFVEAPVLLSGLFSSQTDAIVLAGPRALRVEAEALLGKDFRVTARVDRLPPAVTTKYLEAHGKAGAAVALSRSGGRLRVDVYARDLAAWNQVSFNDLAPLSLQLAAGVPVDRSRYLLRVDPSLHGVRPSWVTASRSDSSSSCTCRSSCRARR